MFLLEVSIAPVSGLRTIRKLTQAAKGLAETAGTARTSETPMKWASERTCDVLRPVAETCGNLTGPAHSRPLGTGESGQRWLSRLSLFWRHQTEPVSGKKSAQINRLMGQIGDTIRHQSEYGKCRVSVAWRQLASVPVVGGCPPQTSKHYFGNRGSSLPILQLRTPSSVTNHLESRSSVLYQSWFPMLGSRRPHILHCSEADCKNLACALAAPCRLPGARSRLTTRSLQTASRCGHSPLPAAPLAA